MTKDDQPVHPLFRGGPDEGAKADGKPGEGRDGGKNAVKKTRRASGKGKALAADKSAAPRGGKSASKAATGKRKPAGRRKTAGGSSRGADASGKKKQAGPPPGTVRIQKLLAECGVDSRRACEQIIADGRVAVNGRAIHSLPCFVNPQTDEVRLDGEKLNIQPEKKVYLLLNKPRGVVCTNSDEENRPRAIDLVAHVAQRVFPVGRLDADSTGIVILTNDGEFANLIAHPRYGVVKTYVVEVVGRVEGEAIESLKRGMHLDGKRARATGVKVLQRGKARTLLEIRLNEGRNREIRRMLARLDYKVRSLRRVAIGAVDDRGIKTGKCRQLTDREVELLAREALARD